ncbi:MAG: DNA primase small subunit domain-containing protein [Nanoarchaeota archaeon]
MRPVQKIAISYYSRKDVQNAIFDFCKNRETVPRYLMEHFGKRPDMLDYPSDIFNYAKSGATSFHCSEELWQDPMQISRDNVNLSELRVGWDFLIDIDSKYLDYSKIAAKLLIQALEYHGIKNFGIKFSGSKGFHLIVPWKAFPEVIDGEKTKDKFPEWPRLIANYLQEMIHDKLIEEIFRLTNILDLEKRSKNLFEIKCKSCGNSASIQKVSKYLCGNCKSEMKSMKSTRNKLKCPNCKWDMEKVGEDEIYICSNCQINSQKFSDNFEKKPVATGLIDSVDIVLVASRHLFRVPYSLHEKTALSSIVINKDQIEDFSPNSADPLKIQIKNFVPDSSPNEAKELLIQAIDWQKRKIKKTEKFSGNALDVKSLAIQEFMFPPCIHHILKGIKQDGRKRALFVLLSFFVSLNFPMEFIDAKINDWNKKNYKPLREGYIKAQLDWFLKNKILPPNCDKVYYKELGIQCQCHNIKNPINYSIKEALRLKHEKKSD